MTKRTLLIATTNKGKFTEIQAKYDSLDFDIIGLDDLQISIEEPVEYGKTIEENSLIKAKHYGDISGHLTLADDSGLFIDALDGWPGVISARVGDTREAKADAVFTRLGDTEDRSATFRVSLALYNPISKTTYMVPGETELEITKEFTPAENTWGYNDMLLVPGTGKTYAQMSVSEKNEHSHRGKALRTMFFELEAMSSHKNIPIGVSFVIQEGKVLMQLRNDPGNTNFHKKWEFPGGGIDFGETMHEHIARETKEESGLEVEVVHHLQHIQVESHQGSKRRYQIVLLPYICKVISGEPTPCDKEVLELRWFELDDVVNHDLVGNNINFFTNLLPEIKEYLKKNTL